MRLLAIETSTKQFSLSVSDGEKILKSRSMMLKKVLSSSIIPSIEKILKEAKLKIKDIDGFVVGLGPGSFTSLRVGLATIKGLAFATQKPVIGIPSLDAIASNVLQGSDICVLCDARRSLIYTALYENNNGRLRRKSEYLLTSLPDLLAKIEADTIFVGDGIALYRQEIAQYFKQQKKKIKPAFALEKYWHPQAKQLIPLALEQISKKKFSNPDKLIPFYLYPDDCQVTPNSGRAA